MAWNFKRCRRIRGHIDQPQRAQRARRRHLQNLRRQLARS
jgi:hypothetical protein